MTALGTGGSSAKCIDYVIDAFTRNISQWQAVATGGPSNSVVAAEAAARTNPSRPYVDVPAFLFELGDIALLVRDTLSKGIMMAGAMNNLRYQFGIAPMVGDLAKLLEFNDQVERRVAVIKKLNGPRGYRRTIDFGRFSGSGMSASTQVQSNPNTYSQSYFRRTSVGIKVHCRWKAAHHPEFLASDQAIRSLAKRAVLGMGRGIPFYGRGVLSRDTLISLYEAMPWSWLIDWCSNLGDYLSTFRNVIPAQLTTLCVMRDWQNHCELARRTGMMTSTVPFVTNQGTYIHGKKSRDPVVLTPAAHFPFLSGSQMSILTSLAILRSR